MAGHSPAAPRAAAGSPRRSGDTAQEGERRSVERNCWSCIVGAGDPMAVGGSRSFGRGSCSCDIQLGLNEQGRREAREGAREELREREEGEGGEEKGDVDEHKESRGKWELGKV